MIVQLSASFSKEDTIVFNHELIQAVCLYNIQHLGAWWGFPPDVTFMLLYMLFQHLLSGSSCTLHTPLTLGVSILWLW